MHSLEWIYKINSTLCSPGLHGKLGKSIFMALSLGLKAKGKYLGFMAVGQGLRAIGLFE